MSDLKQRIASLSPEKRALLELHLMKKETSVPREKEIPRREAADSYPLSFAQQRLWFLDRLEPDSPLYNISTAVQMEGVLDVDALQKSLNAIVDRHESLRTVFASVNGEPVQIVSERRSVDLPIIDLSDCQASDREAEVQRQVSEHAKQPFNLSRDLMLRAALLRLSAEEHVLILVLHHIASDGWSMGVLFRELAALYKAFSSGELPRMPELPFQYADFAIWQRQWLQGEILESQLSYWREQLKDAPPMLDISDRPRPAVQTYQGVRRSVSLPGSVAKAVNSISRQEGVTPFMTLLAALNVLLFRYSGQEDIAVGSPIANRNRVEIEGLIGFFVNTLVLRTDLSGNPSFRELLGRVRQMALGAYAHQDVPFEKLVEELEPERNLSYNPLFQVMFILQNAPMRRLELPGMTITPLKIERSRAKFDLTLSLTEADQELRGSLEYNTDLFGEDTIERMLGHFRNLLEAALADPEQRISELPIMTPTERNQLLVEWNNTQADYPQDQCIHHLFEAQVERTPDAVAVTFEDRQMTYAELNAKANQLAHYLLKRDSQVAHPEMLIGIYLERSLEMCIGLLGILKAGGAYVPLDTAHPQERLAFMLEDTKLPVILTRKQLLGSLPQHTAEVVCLDSDWELIASESAENPAPVRRSCATREPKHKDSQSTKSDGLAYVLYTSGSTGRPKGVLGTHGGAVNRFNWMWETYPFGAEEVCCQKTVLSFVDSVWEFFGPLLKGVPVVIIPDALVKDANQLVQVLAERHVTRIVLVPSLLRVLLDTCPDLQRQLPGLKYWITSGEALSTELLKSFRKAMPEAVLLNLYGSSEVSADVTCYDTSDLEHDVQNSHLMPRYSQSTESVLSPKYVPIGRPIANTQIYILDRHLIPVPIGVPGEVCVGGASLASGYLNRPDLTAEKFVVNSFGHEPGAKLYRTGDLARYMPDGNIELLGRLDHQVKVRGFRIELGEIESVLMQHPRVREAVVLAREDETGSKRLIGYVVPDQNQVSDLRPGPGNSRLVESDSQSTKSEVRRDSQSTKRLVSHEELGKFLEQKVPGYMIPSNFVFVDSFPLTSSGKVDRRSLPDPDSLRPELGETYVAPRDELELKLTLIWEKVLDIHPIGVRDSFFDIGGHSLLAVRLFAQIQKAFGKNLPLVVLFQAPTIEKLASILRQEGWSLSSSSLVAIQAGGSRLPFFWVHACYGEVLFFNDLARHLGPEQPFYTLRAQGLDGEGEIHTRVEDMAADYVKEIQNIQTEGPYLIGGAAFGGWIALEMAQQLIAQGQEVALVALVHTFGIRSTRPSNSPAPELRRDSQSTNSVSPSSRKSPVRYISRALHILRRGQLIRVFRKRIQGIVKTPPTPGERRFQEVRDAIRTAVSNYEPRSYPGQVIYFLPDHGIEVFNLLGTRYELAVDQLDVRIVTGDHLNVLKEPHVQSVAEQLRTCVDEKIK